MGFMPTITYASERSSLISAPDYSYEESVKHLFFDGYINTLISCYYIKYLTVSGTIGTLLSQGLVVSLTIPNTNLFLAKLLFYEYSMIGIL